MSEGENKTQIKAYFRGYDKNANKLEVYFYKTGEGKNAIPFYLIDSRGGTKLNRHLTKEEMEKWEKLFKK